jgi:hypothetical protein
VSVPTSVSAGAGSRNPPCGLHVPKGATLAPVSKDEGARAVQAICRIRAPDGRRGRSVTVYAVTMYAVTSLALGAASPAQLAGWLRGHWRIENRLHWVGDVTFG